MTVTYTRERNLVGLKARNFFTEALGVQQKVVKKIRDLDTITQKGWYTSTTALPYLNPIPDHRSVHFGQAHR